jgi:hypothetical protein
MRVGKWLASLGGEEEEEADYCDEKVRNAN